MYLYKKIVIHRYLFICCRMLTAPQRGNYITRDHRRILIIGTQSQIRINIVFYIKLCLPWIF